MADNLFVGIPEPTDVRRNLLESSKNLINSLQTYEKLEAIRSQKVKYLKEIGKVSSELDLLITKLKQKMPQQGIRRLEKREHKKQVTETLITPNKKLKYDLKKLEEQMVEIEDQLKKLK